MIIGKKSSQNPGYIFAPYVISEKVAIIEGDMKPKKSISSRYVQTVASRFGTFLPKNLKRAKKAKKILEKIEDLKSNQK